MSERETGRKTLSEWLRDEAVYRADDAPAPGDGLWREALLEDFEYGPAVPSARPAAPAEAPLTPRQVLTLAPVGVGLFVLGWLVGSGQLDAGRLAGVPPLAWAAVAAAGSLGWMLWRGVGARRSR